ncbi:MAG: hypothetical protein AAF706_03470 [Bacteroidota bacterium]
MANLLPPLKKLAQPIKLTFLMLLVAIGYTVLMCMQGRGQAIPYYWLLVLRGVGMLLFVVAMLQELRPYFKGKSIHPWVEASMLNQVVTTFAMFIAVSYMIPLFMHSIGQPDAYNWLLGVRVVGALLCVGLLLKSQWPQWMLRYLADFYHLTLLFCLPFMTTFLFLLEGDSMEWIVNVFLVVTLLMILVDVAKFLTISALGIALAIGLYRLGIGPLNLVMDLKTIDLLLYVLPVPIFGVLSYKARLHTKYVAPTFIWVEEKIWALEEHPEMYLAWLEEKAGERAIARLLTERKEDMGQRLLNTLVAFNPSREEAILSTAQDIVKRDQATRQRAIDLESYWERTFKALREAV